ncbi:MAG TPA: hypothetical protein VLN26_06540 [Gaiellaceae bacterium]|nr:hypothetical protein [Gaiellaceae bacterium]
MKKLLVLAAAAVLAAAIASSASAAGGATLLIRHEHKGCHSWSLNGDAFAARQTAHLSRGASLVVVDNDVMPHLLLQTGGPKVAVHRLASSMGKMATPLRGPGLMAHMGASVKVSFPKAGTYTFTTKAGEDYMSGIETVGEDTVLTLKVVVA